MTRTAFIFLILFPVLAVLVFVAASSAKVQEHASPLAGLSLSATDERVDRPVILEDLTALQAEGVQEPSNDAPEMLEPPPAEPRPQPVRPTAPPRKVAVKPRTRTVRMLVTAYCACPQCCGKWSDGITASGKSIYANGSKFVAADPRVLGFGRRVSIPGYNSGSPVPVYDTGSRIKGNRLDVFFRSHSQAKAWGSRWVDVTIYLE